MHIIDGKKIAADIQAEVEKEITAGGLTPGIAVVLVGQDAASHVYVSRKEKVCTSVGIHFEKKLLPETATQDEVVAAVTGFNNRDDIDAILVQLPLPEHIDESTVIAAIDPEKDVDGFHPANIARVETNDAPTLPVLIRAVLRMLESTQEPLAGKKAVIFANSKIFSDPLAAALSWSGVSSTIALGRHITDPAEHARLADIVIVAVGKPNFVRAKDMKDGAIIIDIGTNTLPDGTYTGDVDARGVAKKSGWLSPVPGGVGPVTIGFVAANTVALHRRRKQHSPA